MGDFEGAGYALEYMSQWGDKNTVQLAKQEANRLEVLSQRIHRRETQVLAAVGLPKALVLHEEQGPSIVVDTSMGMSQPRVIVVKRW